MLQEFSLKSADFNLKAYLSCCDLPVADLSLRRREFLHEQELAYLESLSFSRRQASYLLGRYAAKKALGTYLGEKDGTKICLKAGVFNHPVVIYPSEHSPQLSLSHSGDKAAALAFSERSPMALDLEKIDAKKQKAMASSMTKQEKILIASLPLASEVAHSVFWTLKEALGKVLRCGLAVPTSVLELARVEVQGSKVLGFFKNFNQYQGKVWLLDGMACALVWPREMELRGEGFLNHD